MAPPNPDRKKNNQPYLKLTTIDIIGGIFCSICKTSYRDKRRFEEHYIEEHQNINNDISYTCVACYKEFPNYSRFRGHCYTSHVNKSRFQCKKCYKYFSKQTALEEHEATHSFTCPPPCNQEFSSKQELQMHKLVHKDSGPPYSCQICKKEITQVDSCGWHIDEHAVFTYSCPICSENFDNRTLAAQHLTKHFGDDANIMQVLEDNLEDCDTNDLGGILCCYCDKTYKFKTDFDEHFQNDHEDELLTYTCNICENQYDVYAKFAAHCYNHLVKKKFKCDNCNKTFARVSLLVTHVGVCEAPPQFAVHKPFHCQNCDLSFACNWRLTKHMRLVHGDESVRCLEPDCGEEFDSMKKLVLHQLEHKKNENFCHDCGLQFKSLSMCEKHLDVHMKRSYSCPICDKKFDELHQSMLRSKHIQQHFQLALHVCKTCGKIYNARHRLMTHMKTHTGAKNFECKTCGKAFPTIERLNEHMYTHTGEKPYKCVVCGKAFTSYPNWYKHVKRIHNIDPKTVRHMLPSKQTVKIEGETYKISVVEEAEVVNMESSDSSNVTEATTNDLDRSSPNLLEEAYMFVQSICSENSIELDHIDPSILDDLHRDTSNTNANPNGDAATFSNLQANGAVVTEPSSQQMMQTQSSANYPREYGPDFINQGLEASVYNGQIIDLDDHILPHIDPMLTIKEQNNPQELFIQNMTNVPFDNIQDAATATEFQQKWEPPIITKIYQNYGFAEMPGIGSNIQDMYRSVIQTDIY